MRQCGLHDGTDPVLVAFLGGLPPQTAAIMRAYLGLGETPPHSYQRIATALGLETAAVRRVATRGFTFLHALLSTGERHGRGGQPPRA